MITKKRIDSQKFSVLKYKTRVPTFRVLKSCIAEIPSANKVPQLSVDALLLHKKGIIRIGASILLLLFCLIPNRRRPSSFLYRCRYLRNRSNTKACGIISRPSRCRNFQNSHIIKSRLGSIKIWVRPDGL